MVKKLPNQILVLPNADKDSCHEKPDKTDMANFAHPSRILLCSPCNAAKSNTFKTMLFHALATYDRIVIYHNDQ